MNEPVYICLANLMFVKDDSSAEERLNLILEEVSKLTGKKIVSKIVEDCSPLDKHYLRELVLEAV